MVDPQGLILYPGLNPLPGGSFTLSHGIRPSVANIPCQAVSTNLPETGPLTLTYGGVQIVFPDCRVVDAKQQSRGLTWNVQIQDRRWRWQFGEISGVYNQRDPDGQLSLDVPRKSAQDLARLLLSSMGEQGYDVSALPKLEYPGVEWEHSNPAVELDRLCERYGCRVVLGLNNRVKIVKVNQGIQLPMVPGLFVHGQAGYGSKPLPRYVRVIMAPIRFQSKFQLAAVGLDTDGEIKPIDKLSYMPPGGWSTQDPRLFSGIQAGDAGPAANLQEAVRKKNARVLALATVYRWYRIDKLADGTMHPNGLDKELGPFDQLWQYLPISTELVEKVKDSQGKEIPRKAWIEGEYWPGSEDYKNTAPHTQYSKNWTLDADQGIVQFDEPVIRVDEAQRTWGGPASLYLTCSYQLQRRADEYYGVFVRGYRTREVNRRAKEHEGLTVWAEDLLPTIRHVYDDNNRVTTVERNQDDLDSEADELIEAELAKYTPEVPRDHTYAGFVRIEPDGAIQQVTWSTTGQGVFTRASRMQEHAMNTAFHEERRREAREWAKARREIDALIQRILRKNKRLGI